MKKILSIMALVLLSCTIMLTGCGSDPASKKEIVASENSIGNLSIVTYADSKSNSMPLIFNLGHSYITFQNTSLSAVQLGPYNVQPNETICIGTWSISSHFGVWYNVESIYTSKCNKYDGRISIAKPINLEDVATINQFVSKNDTWSPLKNCSYFALNLWNSVATKTEQMKKPIIYSPNYISKQIKMFDNYTTNNDMGSASTFGYYKDTQYVSYDMAGESKYV